MFRNLYDSYNTTWSPQGRLFQLEYAMEAVKQGSCTVGLRSKTHALVVTLKRSSSELGSYQQKIFEIDNHCGVAISGLCGDARLLCRYMRTESLNHKFVYEAPIPIERLVTSVSNKSQVHTQEAGLRPYGVGLLVIGYDDAPHLFETCPSGNFFEFKGQAIGNRSQSARTYIERNVDALPDATLDQLIQFGLKALRESLPTGSEPLNTGNCAIGVVGKDTPFHIIENDEMTPHLATLNAEDDGEMRA